MRSKRYQPILNGTRLLLESRPPPSLTTLAASALPANPTAMIEIPITTIMTPIDRYHLPARRKVSVKTSITGGGATAMVAPIINLLQWGGKLAPSGRRIKPIATQTAAPAGPGAIFGPTGGACG